MKTDIIAPESATYDAGWHSSALKFQC